MAKGELVLTKHKQLLDLYDQFPFHNHPLWKSVIKRELSPQQVIAAELQHYLRSRAGRPLRKLALEMSKSVSQKMFEQLLETYLEECTDDDTGPSHLALVERLILENGGTSDSIDAARNTPANAAAIALYHDITLRGAACHMLGAGVVEYFYADLAPKIFTAYTEGYGFSEHSSETYRLHGPMDKKHAERAFSILDDAIKIHGIEQIQLAVRDALAATCLHYDGMLHGATGKLRYWEGE